MNQIIRKLEILFIPSSLISNMNFPYLDINQIIKSFITSGCATNLTIILQVKSGNWFLLKLF